MENELRFINDDIKSKYIDGTEVVGIGSEGCVYDFYNKVNKIIMNKNNPKFRKLRYRLIVPRIPEKHMGRIVKSIYEFIQVFDTKSIVINDYGLLHRLNKLNYLSIDIILGRTLIRTLGDTPWYNFIIENEKKEQQDCIIQSNILHIEKLELFKRYGVNGVELSPIKSNQEVIDKLHKFDISSFVHFDSEIATIGRTCPYIRMLHKYAHECKENCDKVINIKLQRAYGVVTENDASSNEEEIFPHFWGLGNVIYHKKNIDRYFQYEKSDGVIFNYLLDDNDKIERARKKYI